MQHSIPSDKVIATYPLIEKNDGFMGVRSSFDHLAYNQISVQDHIKVLHLLHLHMWQRAKMHEPEVIKIICLKQ